MIVFYKKNDVRKRAGLILGLLLISLFSAGQIAIEPGPDVTPEDMVENIVGDGIIYDNVTFQGADASRGIFSNGESTNIGINSGIFLTSGAGYNIPGPNSSYSAGSNNGTPGNATLNGITTSTTYDAAVLEFDFIPESDTLRFKYVFGSEEYDEWVNTSFNDVFGYFVSGPDPTGGFYSDKNIAIIPGTTQSVTINNVNNGNHPGGVVPTGPCENCAYYTPNTFGLTIEYDGFTTVLVAWLLVVPCEEYHIKIGVADAGDGIYDSGVFIEENSFESPKIEVETDPFPQGVSDNMIEGCVEADIIFKLPSADYAPITVYFEVTGTANPAAYPEGDFEEEIPTSITFEEDTDTAVIHVAPVKDGITEGDEDLILIIENTLGCIVRYDTVVFTIIDYIDMVSTTSPNTMICQGQAIEIWVNAFNGIPYYTYEWEGFTIDNDTITVSPDTTTMYHVDVLDLCNDTISDSVEVIVFPVPEVDIGGDSTFMCEGDTIWLNAGTELGLSYLWNDGSTDSTLMVTGGGLYYVTVFGPGGCSTVDSIFISETIVEVDLGNDQVICVGDTIVFDPGSNYMSYLWQDGSTNQTFTATQTGTYWVEVSVGNCSAIDSVYLYVDDPNLGVDLGADTTICYNDEITLGPQFGVFETYLWSTGDTTQTITISEPGTYELLVTSQCGDATDQININQYPYPDPELGEDLNLCFGQTATLEPAFGFSSYTWQDNSTLPFYTVTQAGIYYVDVTDIHGCPGSDTVYVEIADIVDLGEDSLILCLGETITLDAGPEFDFYSWSNGQNGVQSIDVETGGWYKVDVNYFFGCPSADSVLIDDYPVPEAEITGNEALCEGDTIELSAPEGNFTYYWNNVEGSSTYSVSQGGNVSLKMSNVCGEDTDDLMVTLNPLPAVDIGTDQLLFPGETVTLDAGEFESYLWNNNPSLSGRYYEVLYEEIDGEDSVYVEVFDGFCKNSDGILIEAFNVKIPNVVTPNGDGSNDDFSPMEDGFTGIKNHTMSIFNRWGEKVWESNDFMSGWDVKRNGKYVADGTYFWVLEVFYGPENTKKVYKGTLTVIGTGS